MRRAIFWTLASLALFVAVEAALFRLPWYYRYLQPMSNAGTVELREHWLRKFHPPQRRQILVVGDSRIGEGFSARQATEMLAGQEVYFWNLGMPASSPRVWYYVLRDADPQRNRFRLIVLALDHYTDEDAYDSAPDRILDLSLLAGRLRLTDVPDFANSLLSPDRRHAAWVGATFKGTLFKEDVKEFLQNIPARMQLAANWREHGLDYVLGYDGRAENVEGLTADWTAHTLTYPPGLSAEQRDSIRTTLMPDVPPQSGDLTRYRKLWLGRILDLYRHSQTKIVFVEMPRGPLQRPAAIPPRFIDSIRNRPGVVIEEASTFRDLETPETFFDGMHLNRKGRDAFTVRLSRILGALITALRL